MALDINSKLLGIPCSKCGTKISETIQNIKNNITITCSSRDCRAKIEIKADNFKDEIKEIKTSVKKIREILQKLNA